MKTLPRFVFALVFTSVVAWAATMTVVPVKLGLQRFEDGDSIVIEEVRATSPRMDVGDTVVVRGRYRLISEEKATLAVSLTRTQSREPMRVSPRASTEIKRGWGDFEVSIDVQKIGCLHLTFNRLPDRKAIGTVYFGTPEQLDRVRNMRW